MIFHKKVGTITHLSYFNTVEITVEVQSTGPIGYTGNTRTYYTVYGDGTIEIRNVITSSKADYYLVRIV